MQRLGLELPAEVVQSELTSYVLHLEQQTLTLHQPDPRRRIFSVYRGGGPLLGAAPRPVSFDGWLLAQAQQRGARLQLEQVNAITPGPRPRVSSAQSSLEADLVVLATGINRRAPLDPAWGYRAPGSEAMAQEEVPWPFGLVDTNVHIFYDHPPGLIFGGIIPKGRYASISLLGHKLGGGAISQFLAGPRVARVLPAGLPRLCGCAPHVAVAPAHGYYADRLVAVGDAAVTRLYKDGIGSAFVTAEAAAKTAVQRGVRRQDFAAGYRPVCDHIARDNRYGKLLFWVWRLVHGSPPLLGLWQRSILTEAGQPRETHVYARILWNLFTGDEPYRQIFWRAVSLPAFRTPWKEVFKL
jgi:flavin-dependent dehydrogenase